MCVCMCIQGNKITAVAYKYFRNDEDEGGGISIT